MYCKRVLRESFVRLYRREDDNCFLILKKKKGKERARCKFQRSARKSHGIDKRRALNRIAQIDRREDRYCSNKSLINVTYIRY